jgi:N-acetylglutamate synthase-like GNAT family acetyltransferase
MEPDQVIIRKARAGDCAILQDLYVELTRDDNVCVTPEGIETALSDHHTCLLVAEINEQIVGTALVSLCADVMYGSQPFAVVENVIVSNDIRGNDIGTRIMKCVESFCLESDCTKIMLLSSASRTGAHSFFEKMGFSAEKKRGFIKYRRELRPSVRNSHNASVNNDTPHAERVSP